MPGTEAANADWICRDALMAAAPHVRWVATPELSGADGRVRKRYTPDDGAGLRL